MCESQEIRDTVSFYCMTTLYNACLERARDIRYGRQKAQSPAERVWAKRLTFAEAYSMGTFAFKKMLQSSSKPLRTL